MQNFILFIKQTEEMGVFRGVSYGAWWALYSVRENVPPKRRRHCTETPPCMMSRSVRGSYAMNYLSKDLLLTRSIYFLVCGERTDLAFAIDASGSMGDAGFAKAKRFIKALIASFKVSNKGTHVGLIRYSTQANVIFDFNQHFSHDAVDEAIDNVEFTEGGTKTELALQLARTRLYSKRGGSRSSPAIFKLFILLTDGRSENPKAVAQEAKLLKDNGVHVMAVGIGKYTNQKELQSIATSKSDVIGVVSFRELMIRMNEIKDKLCEGNCMLYLLILSCTSHTDVYLSFPSFLHIIQFNILFL